VRRVVVATEITVSPGEGIVATETLKRESNCRYARTSGVGFSWTTDFPYFFARPSVRS